MICKGDYYSTALKFVKVEGMDAWGVWEACRWKRTFAHSVADSSLFCTKVYSPYYCLFEMYLSSLYDKGSRYCDSNGLLFLFVLQEKSDELYWIYFHWTYLFFVVFYSFRCQEDGKYTLFFAPLFIDEISIDAYKPPVSIFNDSIFYEFRGNLQNHTQFSSECQSRTISILSLPSKYIRAIDLFKTF